MGANYIAVRAKRRTSRTVTVHALLKSHVSDGFVDREKGDLLCGAVIKGGYEEVHSFVSCRSCRDRIQAIENREYKKEKNENRKPTRTIECTRKCLADCLK